MAIPKGRKCVVSKEANVGVSNHSEATPHPQSQNQNEGLTDHLPAFAIMQQRQQRLSNSHSIFKLIRQKSPLAVKSDQ